MTDFARSVPAIAPARTDLAAAPLVLVLLFTLAVVAIHPIGYRGGGGDDFYYLEAARCAAGQLFCLPDDHWSSRFTLIAPLGLSIAILGESRESLWVVPAAFGLSGIAFVVLMLQRQFGRLEATIGGLALAATPAISTAMIQPNIDQVEFAFIMAALFCFQAGLANGRSRWIAAAGAMLALAIQSRQSAAALLPIAAMGFLLLPPEKRRLAGLFAAGLGAMLAAEAAFYAARVGDPFRSWKLALGHSSIPSAELPAGIDLSRSPLFNLDLIRNWRRPMDIHVHWTLDPLLNLVMHPSIGLTLMIGIAFAALKWRRLVAREGATKIPLLLLTAGSLYFGALVFALAIDPKPRMFLPLAAAASAVFAILGAELWRAGSARLVALFLALLSLHAAIVNHEALGLERLDPVAAAWIRESGEPLSIDFRTSRFLALVPEARRLPLYEEGVSKRLLIVGIEGCDRLLRDGAPGWRMERGYDPPSEDGPLTAALRTKVLPIRREPSLCLLNRS